MPDVGSWPRPSPRWPDHGSIWDEFDPRDIAEALLINALIRGGWPRAKAPDRAAILFDRSFEQNDRFVSSDTAGYEKYLDGLSAQGQIEPQLRAQLVSYVAAPQTGAPARPESVGAGGPSYADGIDPGGPRYAEGIDTQTEPAPEQGSAEPQVTGNPEPASPEPVDGHAPSSPVEPERTIKSASEAIAKKNKPENHSEAGRVLVDIVAGRTSLDDLRDENGNVRIGAFTLAPDVAEIVARIIALDPKDEAERQALGKLIGTGWEGSNGRTDSQNTMLRTLFGRKLKGGEVLTGKPEWDGFDIARLDEDGAFVEQRANDAFAGDLAGRGGPGTRGTLKVPVEGAIVPGKGAPRIPALPAVSKTISPLTKDEFTALPSQGLVDPNRIRTSQANYSEAFRPKRGDPARPVKELVEELQAGKDPKAIEPIRIFEREGKVYTLDHRRLIAARVAGTKVHFEKASPGVVEEQIGDKFTTMDDGMSIVLRAPQRRGGNK